MNLNLSYKFAISSLIFFAFFFIGCSNDGEVDSNDLAYLKYIEEENEQLRKDLNSKISEIPNQNILKDNF